LRPVASDVRIVDLSSSRQPLSASAPTSVQSKRRTERAAHLQAIEIDSLAGLVGRSPLLQAIEIDSLAGLVGRSPLLCSSPACCAHGNLYPEGGRGYEPRSTASPSEEEGATLEYISI